jgi:metal-dependent amidase/aminoacylase/carboxypeptidase family protein
MDAVADDEVFDGAFRSETPGASHLCGHDLHTAVGIGVARVLAMLRPQLPGRVVFLFQPAEETLSGAQTTVDDGVLSRHRPDEIYALHCMPLPVGTFAVMPGVGLPGHDNFDLELIGPSEVAKADQFTNRCGPQASVLLIATAAARPREPFRGTAPADTRC